MKKNKPDAMIIDDFGNIYYSAASLNELKEKYKEELTLEKNAYNRMYNMYVEKDNIINELEKVLDENVELTYVHYGRRQYNKILTEGGLLFRDYIKSKLQELKGSDKE